MLSVVFSWVEACGLWVSVFGVFWVLFGVVVLSGGFGPQVSIVCVCVCVCVCVRACACVRAWLGAFEDGRYWPKHVVIFAIKHRHKSILP